MIRALIYALISIVAISFLRMVIGIIGKGFSDLMKEETEASRPQQASSTSKPPPTRGELKACHTCGTYVVASTALTASSKGETLYYCSKECKAKNAAA
ncbi:MAG: hypothetical protein JST93_27335 [Acidobacteria bacterium]|nr:hypothetical protein [Acidobacteriota bacterium]